MAAKRKAKKKSAARTMGGIDEVRVLPINKVIRNRDSHLVKAKSMIDQLKLDHALWELTEAIRWQEKVGGG
jgi:hypothetical protein